MQHYIYIKYRDFSARQSKSLTVDKLIYIWGFWSTKLLKLFVVLSWQVLLLVLCKKSKSSPECSLSFISLLSSEASCASNLFLLQQISYFGLERLLHPFIHKCVSSFSTSIVIVDDTELRMQRSCNYVIIVGKFKVIGSFSEKLTRIKVIHARNCSMSKSQHRYGSSERATLV